MSTIYVNIADHPGEAAKTGTYKDQIACSAMRHAVKLSVVAGLKDRVQETANNGPIALTHAVDKASPKLKASAMAGAELGQIVITRVSTIAGATRPVETITLGDETYIVRVDVDTPIVQSTLELSDELMETFYIAYGSIQWSYDTYEGNVKKSAIVGEFPMSSE